MLKQPKAESPQSAKRLGQGEDMPGSGAPAQPSGEGAWQVITKIALFVVIPVLLMYAVKTLIP